LYSLLEFVERPSWFLFGIDWGFLLIRWELSLSFKRNYRSPAKEEMGNSNKSNDGLPTVEELADKYRGFTDIELMRVTVQIQNYSPRKSL